MTITKIEDGKTEELCLEGWLDTRSAPELAAVLDEMAPDIEYLILDMAKTEYISSAGIRQIVVAYKQMHGNLTLKHVPPEVMKVLNMSGVSKKIHIEE